LDALRVFPSDAVPAKVGREVFAGAVLAAVAAEIAVAVPAVLVAVAMTAMVEPTSGDPGA
jgi:hypothetical protein